MTDIIQGKDGHYTRERRTLQQGETDFIMVPQFFAVSRFSFVAKDIGIPIVFIQNGGTENLLRMITDYVYQFRGEDRDQSRGILLLGMNGRMDGKTAVPTD